MQFGVIGHRQTPSVSEGSISLQRGGSGTPKEHLGAASIATKNYIRSADSRHFCRFISGNRPSRSRHRPTHVNEEVPHHPTFYSCRRCAGLSQPYGRTTPLQIMMQQLTQIRRPDRVQTRVGLSQRMICGSSTKARARPARLRMPPEISLGNLSSSPARPTISSFSMTMLRIVALLFPGVLAQRKRRVVVEVHRTEQRAVLEHHPEQRADLAELSGGGLDDVDAVNDDFAAFRSLPPLWTSPIWMHH